MYNLKHLEAMLIFSTVIDVGSFTAAGEALGLSKSVVSKQITQLEQQLGVSLLNRTTRRLHLTEAGATLYAYCQRIREDVKEAQQVVGQLQTEPQGLLRISAPQSISMSLLLDSIAQFHSRYPLIRIELQVSGQHLDLIEAGYDLALRIFHENAMQDASLKARKMTSCQFVVCAAPAYLARHAPIAQPADLQAHNCLIYTQRQQSAEWLFQSPAGQNQSVRVTGNLQSNDASLLLRSALAGHGLLFGPDLMCKPQLQSGALIPVLTDYQLPPSALFAVYPSSSFVPRKLRVFIDFLSEILRTAAP